MTEDQKSLMEMAIECDGAEITEDLWPDAEKLVELGLATLSGTRGPNGAFKRIVPVMKPVYTEANDGTQ